MKKYLLTAKKQFSTLALGCALVISAALALVNCTDPAPTKYTVTFNTNGGIPVIADKIVEAGKLLAQPSPDPTKEGYTFAEWYKDQALTQRFEFSSEKITQNITLYAKWMPESTATTYTVTFDMNGGEPFIKDKTVEAGKLLAKPSPDPTKEEYTFVGWHKNEELTQTFNFATEKISANITLYAKWVMVAYTVTFNSNGGALTITEKAVEAGTLLEKPSPDPIKVGYTFTGWYKNEGLTQAFNFATEKITADITLYAKWKSHLRDIPDAHFRAKLQALIPNAFVGEKLNIASGEVTRRKQLDVSTSGTDSIKDLTGIHYFTALTQLYCNSNKLTGLDVSKNTALTTLVCSNNQLARLDVSTNTVLTALNCSNNSLADLDLSANTALTQLYCSHNSLADLDLSTNTALTQLYCSHNSLADLDLSTNTALTQLYCNNNKLTSLDVRGVRSALSLLSVHAIDGETNLIDTLKVHVTLKDHAQIHAIKTARGNKVTIKTYSAADGSTAYTLVCSNYDPTVDREENRCVDNVQYTVTFNSNGGSLVDPIYLYREGGISKPVSPTKADSLFVGWHKDAELTQVFNFNAETITADITLYAKWEDPTRIAIPDAHFRAKLKALIPNAFVGEELDSTSQDITARRYLDVSTSGTEGIKDLTGIRYFTTLTDLYCSDNQLTGLDVSKNTQLVRLYCGGNQLDNLDVSKNTALKELDCSGNQLDSLDVSKNTQLVRLYCGDNQLDNLDVSKNTALISLNCSNNALTGLDVSTNTALTSLRCNFNNLTNLNVSTNTALTQLDCSNNALTGLDMRGMRSVTSLSVHQATGETNAIETLKVHENLQDNAQISAVKTTRGDKITISTYSAATGSTTYTAVCNDYDPTADDGNGGKGVCN